MNAAPPDSIVRIPLEAPSLASGIRAFGVTYDRLLPDFYAGDENAAIAKVFRAVQEDSLSPCFPIVFYGATGSGKTALAYSLQSQFELRANPKRSVQCGAADFARNLFGAIAADDMQHFRDRVRNASSFLIDGLEHISQKVVAQEELVHVLDELQELGRPTFVTCLELPQSMRGLSKALASRLSSGLLLPVKLPKRGTIQAVADQLLPIRGRNQEGILLVEPFLRQLPDNLSLTTIRAMLLEFVQGSTRSQKKTNLENSLFGESCDALDFIPAEDTKLIDTIIRTRDPQRSLKPQQISKAVAKHTGCALPDMRGSSRKSHVVLARSLAMFLCRKLLGLPLEKIGTHFGGRDHTTVMHAIRKVESRLADDLGLVRMKNDILRELNQTVE